MSMRYEVSSSGSRSLFSATAGHPHPVNFGSYYFRGGIRL